MDAKKFILNLDLHDDSDKQKAMKAVSKIPGIDSITVNMKEMKLTVAGSIDPVTVVNKLRKNSWNTSIFFVGPAKEPEKKKDDKKDDKKKDEGKKEGGGGDKKKLSSDPMVLYNPYIMPYYNYPLHAVTYNPRVNYPQHATTHYPSMATPYYSQEENPNGCVIC